MGAKIDLTGQRFGKLVVLYDSGIRKNKYIVWHCKCDCGNEKDVSSKDLRAKNNKGVRSCGCLLKENGGNNKLELIGQTFGNLTVIEQAPTQNQHTYWRCKCSCGNEITVKGTYLTQKKVTSCGCLKRERARILGKSKIKIIPKGTRFGKLIVIKLLDKRDINGHTIYECQCDCGKRIQVNRINLVDYHTMSCGCSKISKGEFLIKQLLIQNKVIYEQQKTFKDCLFPDTNYYAYFDFYVDNKYIIEFDGIQHFEITGGWNTQEYFKKLQEHDKIKNQWCKDNNIPLIRIPYTHLNELCLEDLIPETSKFLIKGDS